MGVVQRATPGRARGDTSLTELREVAGRVAPVSLAGEQRLSLAPSLAGLFPGGPFPGGLRRGSLIGVAGLPGATGVTSLVLAVLAGPSAAGSWTAMVGLPTLGALAASETGIDLARFALVPHPGPTWPTVVAALLDAIDVVAVAPPTRVRAADARRLSARARERGAVLVVIGSWPEGPDVHLSVTGATWMGIGHGHGLLRSRRLEVVGSGRGASARERRATIELPQPVLTAESGAIAPDSAVRTEGITAP